jgi:hypothetical protein
MTEAACAPREMYVMFRPTLFRDGLFVRAMIRWERTVEWWFAMVCMAREINRKGTIGKRDDVSLLHRHEMPSEFFDYFLSAGWLVEEDGMLRLSDPDQWYRSRSRDPLVQNEQKQKSRTRAKTQSQGAKKTTQNRTERQPENGAESRKAETLQTGETCPQDVRNVSAVGLQKKYHNLSQSNLSQSNPSQENLRQDNPSIPPYPPEGVSDGRTDSVRYRSQGGDDAGGAPPAPPLRASPTDFGSVDEAFSAYCREVAAKPLQGPDVQRLEELKAAARTRDATDAEMLVALRYGAEATKWALRSSPKPVKQPRAYLLACTLEILPRVLERSQDQRIAREQGWTEPGQIVWRDPDGSP